jgi:diguanylate cyclase (GGDEF)-like protein
MLSGRTLAEAMGMPVESVLRLIDQGPGERIANPLRDALGAGAQGRLPPRTLLISRSGTAYPVEDACSPIRDSTGSITGAVLVFRDVTANREMLDRLTYQARHDGLTGLVNRREFELTLEAQLQHARETGHDHALLYIDLDQFKVVNDTAGHQAGDELLRQLSQVMRQRLRQSDLIARLGGDEFGVLLESCPVQRAEQIASALVQCVADFRFRWMDRLFTVGASIGVVPITRESDGVADLLIAADTACYIAKEKGRNRIEVYQADNAEVLQRRGENDWVVRIPAALEHDRFRLFAQRIVPVGANPTDSRSSFEILLRLQNQDGALIPPMAFLPAAERYSVMPRIDRWVIRQSLQALQGQPSAQRGNAARHYAINLSGASLSDEHLLAYIRQQFAETGVPPSLLCFEITETAAISHLQAALALVSGLKQLGCAVALDDFGSGMSSFSYLKTFPVDYLKIDGSFVRDLRADRFDCAVVEGINRIGRVLGMQTIAEYVEHPEILNRLTAIGIDYAQGYALHRPEPLENVLAQHAAGV